jgi:tetratricopeptide (TPR) repeat protein
LSIAVLGLTFLMTGDADRARELLEQALAIQAAAEYRWGEGQASLYLAITTEATDPQAAAKHYRRSLECLREYRDSNILPNALIGQAGLIGRRDPATALRALAAAWAIRARGGGEFPSFFRERLGRVRQICEAAVGADAERIWAEGTSP